MSSPVRPSSVSSQSSLSSVASSQPSSSSSSSNVGGVTNYDNTIGVSIESDRNEANPGDTIRYWIRVKNLSNDVMPTVDIAFFFDRLRQVILQTAGRGGGDHIRFTVPRMAPGAEFTYTVVTQLKSGVRPGEVIRTYASMVWDGTIRPVCAKHDLHVIARPPVTGAGDATGPLEDLTAFLRPVNAAKNGSAMPLMGWASVAVSGVALGGRLGKKFID